MSNTTTSSLLVSNAAGALVNLAAEKNNQTAFLTTHSVPEINGSPVSQSNPLPVSIGAGGITLTSTSFTLAAGVDTTVLPVNAARKSLDIFVAGAGGLAYLNFDAAATTAGLGIGQAGAFGLQRLSFSGSTVPIDAIHLMSPAGATVVVFEGVSGTPTDSSGGGGSSGGSTTSGAAVLTDSAGNTLTDSAGNPLTASQ